MNKQLTEYEFYEINRKAMFVYTVGSRKYNLHTPESDFDYLLVVSEGTLLDDESMYQYNRPDSNSDWLACSITKFKAAQIDGSDMLVYEASTPREVNYRIIKAYLGLAKRDAKEFEKTGNEKKRYHSVRCLLIADNLMRYKRPFLEHAAVTAKTTEYLGLEVIESKRFELKIMLANKEIEY